MVTTDHSPLDDRIFYKESLSLSKVGFEVHILCHASAEGKVYDMGGNKIINPENSLTWEEQGIFIHAIKRPKSLLQKVLNKLNFSSYYTDNIAKGIEINADVYHAHEPASLYIAQVIAKKNGAKVILDAHESWRGGTRKEELLKKICLPKLLYLISANHITRGALLHLNPYLKTEVIYNYAHPDLFPYTPDPHKYFTPIIVHDGYLPFNRGLIQMLDAIRKLKINYPTIQFRILGETKGKEKEYLHSYIAQHDLQNNVKETGWIDYLEIGNHLADCSIGLITKTPTLNNVLGGPAIKLFHYFHYGIAVVDNDLPESTWFLNQSLSGISVKSRDADGLYDAIQYLVEHPIKLKEYGERSYHFGLENNWRGEEVKLLRFYKEEVLNETKLIIR